MDSVEPWNVFRTHPVGLNDFFRKLTGTSGVFHCLNEVGRVQFLQCGVVNLRNCAEVDAGVVKNVEIRCQFGSQI